MKTRTKLFALALSTVLMSVVLSGLTVNAKKPLYCYKTLDVYPPTVDIPFVTKRGTITGGIDGYFVVYSFDPADETITGKVTHYREEWAIYEDDKMKVELLRGTNTALASPTKGWWHAQGVVEWVDDEYADGRYANLLSCTWYSRGYFDLEGTVGPLNVHLVDTSFRIN